MTRDPRARARRIVAAAFIPLFSVYFVLVAAWLLLGFVSALAARNPELFRALARAAVDSDAPRWLRSTARGLMEQPPEDEGAGVRLWLDYSFSVITIGLALLLVRVRPRHRVVRLLAVGMVGTAAAFNLSAHRALVVVDTAYHVDLGELHLLLLHSVAGIAYVYALLLFPDGRLPTHRWRLPPLLVKPARLVWLVVANLALLQAAFVTGTDHRVFYVVFYGIVAPATGLIAQRRRYRRAVTADERAQCRLLLAALATALATAVVVTIPLVLLEGRHLSVTAHEALAPTSFALFRAAFTLIPIVLVVGILRFRLWEIETLLTRALIVSVLAAVIGLGYVAAVVALPALVGADGSIGLVGSAAVAAGLAVALQPARELVTRGASRLVYGRRPSPFELVSTLARSSGEVRFGDDVMPQLAELARTAVGARSVRITFADEDQPGDEMAAAEARPIDPDPARSAVALPIRYDDRDIAEIVVEMPAGDRLGVAQREFLASFATHAALAAHNIELLRRLRSGLADIERQSGQLQVSRRRLAAATDAERRRMQLAIDEIANRRIAEFADGVRELDRTLDQRPGDAARVIDDLEELARTLLDELRALARGIYPPLLADRGLHKALASALRKLDVDTRLEVGPGLRQLKLEPATETAVYFTCVDAVQSAGAGGPIDVRLVVDDCDVVFIVGARGRVPTLSRLERLEIDDRLAAVGGALDSKALVSGTPLVGRAPAVATTERA